MSINSTQTDRQVVERRLEETYRPQPARRRGPLVAVGLVAGGMAALAAFSSIAGTAVAQQTAPVIRPTVTTTTTITVNPPATSAAVFTTPAKITTAPVATAPAAAPSLVLGPSATLWPGVPLANVRSGPGTEWPVVSQLTIDESFQGRPVQGKPWYWLGTGRYSSAAVVSTTRLDTVNGTMVAKTVAPAAPAPAQLVAAPVRPTTGTLLSILSGYTSSCSGVRGAVAQQMVNGTVPR